MTKTDEIALLQKTIRAFGPASYLGPWLKEYEPCILGSIINDLPVDIPLPADARREGEEILSAARDEAARIVAAAETRARDIEEQGMAEYTRLRETCARALRRALSEVER